METQEQLRAKVDSAFSEMMKLIAPANADAAIKLWVRGTMAAENLGWSKGYDSAKGA